MRKYVDIKTRVVSDYKLNVDMFAPGDVYEIIMVKEGIESYLTLIVRDTGSRTVMMEDVRKKRDYYIDGDYFNPEYDKGHIISIKKKFNIYDGEEDVR